MDVKTMMQIRPREGGLPYAPDRDLANILTSMAARAAHLMDDESEPWFAMLLESTQTSKSDLVEAAKRAALYFSGCPRADIDTVDQLLADTGLVESYYGALTAFLARLGQVVLATYFPMVRESIRIDETPARLDELLLAVKEFANACKAEQNHSDETKSCVPA